MTGTCQEHYSFESFKQRDSFARPTQQMNCLDLVGKPPGIGAGALLPGSAERRIEGATAQVVTGIGTVQLGVEAMPCHTAKAVDGGEAKITTSSLQRMIQEILDPPALQRRSVKEWRGLYKSFFTFFALNGVGDETEREAWDIASAAFNTNLIAVGNRTSQVVPMSSPHLHTRRLQPLHCTLGNPRFETEDWLVGLKRVGRAKWGRPAPSAASTE
jgi:hypothetical protein